MFSFTTSLLACTLLVTVTWANNCSNPGIFVDIHERLVDGREDFFQYGFFIGLGTPSQNNSLWPAITHNETVFSSADYCSLGTTSTCSTNLHGFISTGASSTWQNVPDYRALDDASTVANTSVFHGTDTLNVWTHYFDPSPATGTFVHNFPVGVASNYSSNVDPFFGPGGTFGLGPSSTALDRLYKDNRIAARSYGLYIGSRPDRAGGTQNGSIVMGGYDSGRFTGSLLSYDQVPALPQNAYSPFKVSVSQISLVTKQGQNIALVTDGAFDAYLTTSQFPVQFPKTITQRLATALKATPANNDDNTLKTQSGFDGNLTITLSNNLTFTFGSSWISNQSSISPISAAPLQTLSSNTTTTASDSPLPILLGASFLEQVYMFVQYDSTPPTFSLAQAKLYRNYVQPRPFCPGITPTPAVAPSISTFARKGLTGAVLGGVIGGGALSALIWIFFGACLKSSLRRESQATEDDNVHGKPAMNGPLRRLRNKTKRVVRFSPSNAETDQSTFSKSRKSIVTTTEVEKLSSPGSLTSSPKVEHEPIEMSPLSETGLTIQTSSLSDNIRTQEATYYPPPSALSSNFNDHSLATPIPPTPNSAMPLLLNGNKDSQSGWPSLSQNRNDSYRDMRGPTLTVQTSSPGRDSSPIPTFAPPPTEEQKRKSKLSDFVTRTKR